MTLVEQLQHIPVQQIELDGVIQCYRETGSQHKQAVLLLHGISSGSGSWINQLQMLGQYFHVIAWDAPGYGQSSALTTATPDARDYAERLASLCDALQIEQAIVVGNSLGAIQASAFASLYPHKLAALILANVAQGYQHASDEVKTEVFLKRPTMLKQLGHQGMAQQRGPNLIHVKTEQNIALIQDVMRNINLTGFTHASYLLAYDQIGNYLKNIRLKPIFIAGQHDCITPAPAIAELAKHIDSQFYIEIEAAGHLSYLDQPEQFNQIIHSAASIEK